MNKLTVCDDLSELDARWLSSLIMRRGLTLDFTEEEVLQLKRLKERYGGYGYE